MTAAEAIRKLKAGGYSEEQANSLAEVLEDWEQSRVVTRDYLDKRLAKQTSDLKSWFFSTILTTLLGAAVIILGGVYFIVDHLLKR